MTAGAAQAGVFSTPSGTSTFPGARAYERSSQTDLATVSYQAEITIAVNGSTGPGAAFFGIGNGTGGGAFFTPQAPSISLMVGPSDFGNKIMTVEINAMEVSRTVGPGNGTHRIRFTWDADNKRAMIEVHPNWVSGAAFTPTIQLPIYAPNLALTSSESFFGGGGMGVTLSNFTIKPLLGKSTIKSFPGGGDNDRAYLTSGQADLEDQSYEAEVTVSVNGSLGAGSGFFGIGDGRPNPVYYNEPKDAFSVLLGPSDFGSGILEVQVNGVVATDSLTGQPARMQGGAGNGTHRVRITWDADNNRALVEVHLNWVTGAAFTPVRQFLVKAPGLAVTSDYRFFCGGAGGVTFKSFSATPLLGGPNPQAFMGTANENRAYQRSAQTDLATQSYLAEATVHVAGGPGVACAFFGISNGLGNAAYYYTPTIIPSATFLIGSTGHAGGRLIGSLNTAEVVNQGYPGDGTHRARLRWDAARKRALLEVHPNWTAGTPFVSSYRLLIDASSLTFTKAQRLIAGGAAGVVISDFSATAVPSSDVFIGDQTAGKWIPTGLSAKPVNNVLPVDSMLTGLGGSARLLGAWYDNSNVVATRAFNNSNELHTPGADWKSTVTSSTIPNAGIGVDAQNLSVKFKLEGGSAVYSGVAMAFDFTSWNPGNFVFTPAMLYNGNKFRILPLAYPPYISNAADRPPGMPITTTNILNIGPTSGGLAEMLTSNLATPMAGFFDSVNHKGFLVLTKQKTAQGTSGILIQEDATNGKLSIVVSAPGVRGFRYSGDDGNVPNRRVPSSDRGASFLPGDEVTLDFKVYKFPAADVPEFLAKAFEVRKAMTGANTFRDVTPFSAATTMLIDQHNHEKWTESGPYGYYSSGGNDFRHQIGWNGNPIFGLPQAIYGSTLGLGRAARCLDMLVAAQATTGLFPAIFSAGNRMGDTFVDRDTPANENIAMARRSGDVLFFGLQNLMVLSKQGVAIKPAWTDMLRDCADGLKNLYAQYGEFGQYVNVETGAMVINGSTAGSANIQGLALAAAYFNDPTYLATAKAAGDMYYTRDLSKGYAGGGAAEILQSPDSEAPWDLSEAYMTLHELSTDPTEKQKWLSHARDAINLLASWTVSYDYEFPAGSDLARCGTKVTGSIFASSQNNHSAPGYYIMSGDFLLKYFRVTGDTRYAELYKDITHNVIQYLNTPTNRLQTFIGAGDDPVNPTFVPRYVTERVQLSDWEGPGIGDIPELDSNQAWECLVQLVSLQNPGIYYNTTSDYLIVLDHVKTERISKDSAGTRLKLTNTTPHNATVKILAETSSQAQIPLGHTAYMDWPKVSVNAGQIKYILITPAGAISEYTP